VVATPHRLPQPIKGLSRRLAAAAAPVALMPITWTVHVLVRYTVAFSNLTQALLQRGGKRHLEKYNMDLSVLEKYNMHLSVAE
jgi:hypothetical protein